MHTRQQQASFSENLQHQEGCETPILNSTLPGEKSPARCCDHLQAALICCFSDLPAADKPAL